MSRKRRAGETLPVKEMPYFLCPERRIRKEHHRMGQAHRYHRTERPSAPMLALFTICFLPFLSAAPFDTCYEQFTSADTDGDGVLTADEYTQAVGVMSSGAVTEIDSGSALGSAFSTSIDGVSWSDATSESDEVATACRATYKGILEAQEVSFTTQVCTVALFVGDADRSSGLAQETEFSRFVSYLSGSTISSSTPFDSLSPVIQQVFPDFADSSTGEIDVTGATPTGTPTEEQEQFYADLCDRTAVTINAGDEVATSSPTASSTTAPVTAPSTITTATAIPTSGDVQASPTAGGEYVPSFVFQFCSYSMAFSDRDRNSVLDSEEYVLFVNRLSSNKYSGASFEDLPIEYQDNFAELSRGSDEIDIAGSAPGSSPTADELANLENICMMTDLTIQQVEGEASSSPSPVATTSSPVLSPTTATPTSAPVPVDITLAYTTCVRFLSLSDIDRDGYLSETEYIRFITFGSNRQIVVTSFDDLDPILQETFDDLAGSDGLIDITGSSYGETPTVAQEAQLTEVCETSVSAMNDVLNPDQPVPTDTVNQTVYNAWIVRDPTGALTANSLRSGLNRQALDQGYSEYIGVQFRLILEQASGGTTADSPPAYLLEDSAVNYQLTEQASCPDGLSGTCIKVYSKFLVALVNVDRVEAVTRLLQDATMDNIDSTEDGLQQYITAAYPFTKLVVVNADLPVMPSSSPDENTNVEQDENVSSAGAIAASVIIVLLLVGAIGGGYYYTKKKNLTCEEIMLWLPNIPCLSNRNRKDEDAELTADIEKAAYGDDDDDDFGFEVGQSNKVNDESHGFKYDDDASLGLSVMDQDPSQSGHEDDGAQTGGKGKFSFGLGKKKAAAGTFDGAIGDMGVDAMNENAANDFANYGFDDPMRDLGNGSTEDIFGRKGNSTFESAWGKGPKEKSFGDGQTSGGDGSNGHARDADDHLRSDSDSGSEDEDSYDDEEEEDNENYGRERRELNTGKKPGNMRHLDAMVDQGNWDGVMVAAANIDTHLTDGESSAHSKPSLMESDGMSQSDGSTNTSVSPTQPLYDPNKSRDDNSAVDSYESYSSEELRRRALYRGQVEALVKRVVPDEIDNIDAMLDQFSGREAELIHTLQTMEERTAKQRARKAVHKSKAMPQRENIPFGPGGTEGSAAVAAASTIGVQAGVFDDVGGFSTAGDDFGFGTQPGGFDDPYDDGNYSGSRSQSDSYDSRSQSPSGSHSGSYSGSERSGSRSYYSDEQSGSRASRSYYSDERSGSKTGSYQSGSYRSGAGKSFASDGGSRSYRSGEGSQTGSRRSGSYYSGDDQGSYVSGDGARSYRSGEGSYVSGEGSRSRRSGSDGSYVSGEGSGSYRSGDEGSHVSGEGSRSYRSGDECSYVSGDVSKSYRSGDEGSFVSGRSGDEGSYVSGGSRSYRSGEDGGSYVSGDGSRSYRSGEGSYVSGEGSRSYRSGEDEGSYVSGEGSRSYRSGDEDEGSIASEE